MKVYVIGGSGAFDYDNSSFLIEFDNKKILFDCAQNSFSFVKNNDLDIDYVFISHTHQDHIGGLEKLIYYNYFVKGKITKIVCGNIDIENYLPKEILYENGELINIKMYELIKLSDKKFFTFFINDSIIYNWKTIKGNHIVKDNYGLILDSKTHTLIITGDTKASHIIAKEIERLAKEEYKADFGIIEKKKVIVFHDFQTFGKSINSIHCCEDDFEFYYSNLEKLDNVKFYKYHNKDFNDKFKGKFIEIL